jgi:hypothetical protein
MRWSRWSHVPLTKSMRAPCTASKARWLRARSGPHLPCYSGRVYGAVHWELAPIKRWLASHLASVAVIVPVVVGCAVSDPGTTTDGLTCVPPALLCDGGCLDIASDPANCGACGSPCSRGNSCIEGVCGSPNCPAGMSECDGVCVDLDTHIAHCGQCNRGCTLTHKCINGSCECAAPWGICEGLCVDLRYSGAHCGGCGQACGPNQRCEREVCVQR